MAHSQHAPTPSIQKQAASSEGAIKPAGKDPHKANGKPGDVPVSYQPESGQPGERTPKDSPSRTPKQDNT